MIVAIFDFCETLIQYQTADKFIDFVLTNRKVKRHTWPFISKILRNRYLSIFMGKFFPKLNFGKRMKLLSLRGVGEEELFSLAKLYALQINKDVIPELIEKLHWHKANGHCLVLISGGYEPYLNEFKQIMAFDYVLGSRIEIKNHRVSGFMAGEDCMFGEKVERFKALIKEHHLKVDQTFCYTDSITDLPILDYVTVPIAVSKKYSQSWAEKRNFEQIIWQ
jgi:HAD superfamily hydrolase (TIGR01490 family)